MANILRGEASFEASGKTYTLKYGMNAWAELEQLTGKGTVEVTQAMVGWGSDLTQIRIGLFRSLIWAGLRKHHREMTLDQVGDLIDEVGGIGPMWAPVVQAINASQAPSETEAETKGERPTLAGNGTGSASALTI